MAKKNLSDEIQTGMGLAIGGTAVGMGIKFADQIIDRFIKRTHDEPIGISGEQLGQLIKQNRELIEFIKEHYEK